jgi:hypothetical protein
MSESRRTSTVFSLQHYVCQGHERGVVGYASPAAVHSSPPLTTASSLSMLPQPRSPRYLLLPDWPDDKQQTRRLSAWISRKLRPLRAHALIPKIVGTHRYQLTSNGCGIIVAMLMRYAPRLPQTRRPTLPLPLQKKDQQHPWGCVPASECARCGAVRSGGNRV